MSPLRNKDEMVASCRPIAVQAASSWAYKYPDQPNSTIKMVYKTYEAILKRDGGPYQSRGVGNPYYDFPLAL